MGGKTTLLKTKRHQDPSNLYQDRSNLHQDQSNLYQDRSNLHQDYNKLDKDRDKLYQDYGNLVRVEDNLHRVYIKPGSFYGCLDQVFDLFWAKSQMNPLYNP